MSIIKQTIFIFFFILFSHFSSQSQTIKFAVIASPQIGLPDSESNLLSVIENINSGSDLNFVIVFGNTSIDGSHNKLNSADKLLQKLKIPFYIAPGINDITKSVNGGIDFLQTFGSGSFSFSVPGIAFLSVNPFLSFNSNFQWLNVDERRWMNDFSASSGADKVVFFYPGNPADIKNSQQLNNIAVTVGSSFMFTLTENKISKEIFEGINSVSLAVQNSDREFYYVVSILDENVSVYQRSLSNVSDELLIESSITVPEAILNEEAGVKIISDHIRIKNLMELKETHLADIECTDDIIYAASYNGTITAVDRSGNKKWDYYTGGKMFHSPVRHKDILAAVIFEGDLITLNANNGDVLQVIGLPENITSQPILIDINYGGYNTKGIVISTVKGDIYCYEIYSLELIWSQKSVSGRIISPPVEKLNMLIFQNSDGVLFSLNSASGSLVWKWNSGVKFLHEQIKSGPAADDKQVYIIVDENSIAAIDILQGRKNWVNDNLNHRNVFILLHDNNILARNSENNLVLISAITGKIIKSISLADPEYFASSFYETESKILSGNSSGDVLMINNENPPISLFNSLNTPIVSIKQLSDNLFVSLDLDGRLILFEVTDKD